MNVSFFISKIQQNWKSGLTVAMINIPLSISLAVASWWTPLQWIITWVWAGILASLFASSHYNVFWVAGALSSILMGFVLSVWTQWFMLLPVIAICSWIIMMIIYVLKITKYITLIPSTALHWFLISVWVSLFLWQIIPALWLNNPELGIQLHKEVILNLYEAVKHIHLINWLSVWIFLIGFIFLVFMKKKFPKFPSVIFLTIIGIFLWIGMQYEYFPHVLLLVDKFPNIQFALFDFSYFQTSIHNLPQLVKMISPIFSVSLVIAIIAIIETVISAKIAEKITHVKFDKDREVFGLACANIWSWIFGWLPNTAVFIRTALNIHSWANHKMSGFMIALFTLLISALLFNNAFQYLPFPIIAAILMNIALWLIDITLLKNIFSIDKTAFWITIITMILAVFLEATYGILVGTFITLLIYLKKITQQNANISVFRKWEFSQKISLWEYIKNQQEWDLILLKFSSGLNYLNIETHLDKIQQLHKHQKVLLSLSHIWNIDIDGIETLNEMIEILLSHNIDVYISWIDAQTTYISHIHQYENLKKNQKVFSSSTQALDVLKI